MNPHASENPIDVFGISAETIKVIPRQDLPEFFEQIWRVLAILNHPDRGGDADKAKEINNAYRDLISSKEEFELYINDYIKNNAFNAELVKAHAGLEKANLERANVHMAQLQYYISEQFEVQNKIPLRVELVDFKKATKEGVPGLNDARYLDMLWGENSNIGAQSDDRFGTLINKYKYEITLDKEWNVSKGIKACPNLRIIGSINSYDIYKESRNLIEYLWSLERISFNDFTTVVQFLVPELKLENNLVSFNLDSKTKEAYFSFEGRILSMQEII